MSIDTTITVDISADSQVVASANFGTVVFAAEGGTLGGGFTEVTRTYTTAAEVATDLAATDLTAVAAAAITQALAQSNRTKQVKVANLAALGIAGTLATELDTLLAADSAWYALTFDPADVAITTAFALEAAIWAAANKRNILFQSSDTDLVDGTTPNLGENLQATTNPRTLVQYHDDDADYVLLCTLCKTLFPNPNVSTTVMAHKTIVGSTPYAITSTERAAADADLVNYYTTLKGTGSFWKGWMSDGRLFQDLLTDDWTAATIEEGLAAMFLTVSNAGSKVAMTNEGINQCASILRNVLQVGVNAGHFVDGTITVTQPLESEVSAVDKAANIIRLSFSVQRAGAILEAAITGTIAITI